jgi:hypothetical protein
VYERRDNLITNVNFFVTNKSNSNFKKNLSQWGDIPSKQPDPLCCFLREFQFRHIASAYAVGFPSVGFLE